MDSEKLRKRRKQPGHDRTFLESESKFSDALRAIVAGTPLVVTDKPKDLAGLFPHEDLKKALGIHPEASLHNPASKRSLYFEVKKQGPAGNAEERACKHHTVQFYKTLRSKLGYDFHPYYTVFCENLATDLRYTVKYRYLFEPEQYFCWVGYDLTLLRNWIVQLCSTRLAFQLPPVGP